MPEIRAVTTPAEFLAMREDWQDLLARAPAANIFLTFEWVSTWWRHYGGGARLSILAAYDGEQLIGVAPLMIQERRLAGVPLFRRVAFLGTGLSDRLDMLLTSGPERAILESIILYLRGQRWDIVDLHEVPEDSVTAKLLPEMAEPLAARVEVMEQSVCPVVRLAVDPDLHLAALGKKLRENIAYYGRKLRREHAVSLDFVNGGPRLAPDLAAFLRMYRKCLSHRPDARQFIGDTFAAFRQDVVTRLAAGGRVVLGSLRIDGADAAGALGFHYRGTCYWYNTYYDPAWGRESIGTILHWELIRHLITLGCRELDYLRGDEAFKYQWGAQPRRQVRIRIARLTPKLRLLEAGARRVRGRLARSRPPLGFPEWVGRLGRRARGGNRQPSCLIPEAEIAETKRDLPELSEAKKARFAQDYAIPEYDASVLTSSAALADYFEEVARLYGGDAKVVSNWVRVELLGSLNKHGRLIAESPIAPKSLAELLSLLDQGVISGRMAKEVIEKMYRTGKAPGDIVRQEGLVQISDEGELLRVIEQVLEENPLAEFKAGKKKSFTFLVGQVMKATRGKANPTLVNELLKKRLSA